MAALHVSWDDLAEIRSLAVAKEHKKRGIGRQLVERCLGDAEELGVGRVFVLTYIPEFFGRVGFAEFDKAKLPHKVWSECLKCVEVSRVRRDGDDQKDRVMIVSKSLDRSYIT